MAAAKALDERPHIRFSDAGQPHAKSQPEAEPAGVRKPPEKETAGDCARSSSNGLWGFEDVGWGDGRAGRCERAVCEGGDEYEGG